MLYASSMYYSVKQLADIAGVSIRTLHHYDRIGLLQPAHYSDCGYRRYGESELLRLQQILFFRELGFPLARIGAILDSERFDLEEALADQRKVLQSEIVRLTTLIATIDRTTKRRKGSKDMNDKTLYEGFGHPERDAYAAEAEKKWGHTEAWRQSQERTKGWGMAEIAKVQEEMEEIASALVALIDSPVDSPDVKKIMQRQHAWISQFYECGPEMFRGLAQLYIDDSRFAATYQKFHPDLPEFLSSAMKYYSDGLELR